MPDSSSSTPSSPSTSATPSTSTAPGVRESRTDTQIFRSKDPRASTGIRPVPVLPQPSRKPRARVIIGALVVGLAGVVYAFFTMQQSGMDVQGQMDLQARMDKVENQMQNLTIMLNQQNARISKMESMQQEELRSLKALHERFRQSGGWDRGSQPEANKGQ